MPQPGKMWRHVVVNTLCSWLHGDQRGFRSRHHEIHSSGDYKKPPPKGEHEGLNQWMKKRARKEVQIPRELRNVIGEAFRDYLQANGHRVIAMSVNKTHAHGLAELPSGLAVVKAVIGNAKRTSSRAVKKQMPGEIWSYGGTFKPVDNRDYLESSHDYIIYDQGAEAWTWSFRDKTGAGMFDRQRPPWKRKNSARRGQRVLPTPRIRNEKP
jgi:REP element-mobilizing transposase RayT